MLTKIRNLFRKFFNGKKGQGMTEYLLIAALIAIACMGLYQTLGKTIFDKGKATIATLEKLDTDGHAFDAKLDLKIK